MNPSPITIESHPPERRRRAEIHICHGCCCCCCCLHTIGGIIGAVVMPMVGKPPQAPIGDYYFGDDDDDDFAVPNIALPGARRGGVSATKVFWALSAIAVLLGMMIGAANKADGFGISLLILAIFFPGIQLGVAVITFIWLALTSRPDRSYQMRQVGKIMLGLFLGAAAGMASMVGIGVVLR